MISKTMSTPQYSTAPDSTIQHCPRLQILTDRTISIANAARTPTFHGHYCRPQREGGGFWAFYVLVACLCINEFHFHWCLRHHTIHSRHSLISQRLFVIVLSCNEKMQRVFWLLLVLHNKKNNNVNFTIRYIKL